MKHATGELEPIDTAPFDVRNRDALRTLDAIAVSQFTVVSARTQIGACQYLALKTFRVHRRLVTSSSSFRNNPQKLNVRKGGQCKTMQWTLTSALSPTMIAYSSRSRDPRPPLTWRAANLSIRFLERLTSVFGFLFTLTFRRCYYLY